MISPRALFLFVKMILPGAWYFSDQEMSSSPPERATNLKMVGCADYIGALRQGPRLTLGLAFKSKWVGQPD